MIADCRSFGRHKKAPPDGEAERVYLVTSLEDAADKHRASDPAGFG